MRNKNNGEVNQIATPHASALTYGKAKLNPYESFSKTGRGGMSKKLYKFEGICRIFIAPYARFPDMGGSFFVTLYV